MTEKTIKEQLEHYARRNNWVDEDIEFVIMLLGAAYEDGYVQGHVDGLE